MTAACLQQAFLGGGQGVDTRGEHRLHRGRDLDARRTAAPGDSSPRAPSSTPVSTSDRTISSMKNGFPLARSTRKLFSGRQARIGAQQGLKEFRKALAGQRIQPQLVIIRPVPPFVLDIRGGR